METQYTVSEKPTLVNVIAWTTLASGIVNLGWGLAVSAVAFVTIVGICCVPLTILPAILGIFEIIYAAKLLSTPPQAVKPAINLAVLEVVCILAGNFFSMIVGILSLIFYNDPAVKDYFARLNGMEPPAPVPLAPQVPPVVPVPPSPAVEPIPSPIMGEEPVVPPAPAEEPQSGEEAASSDQTVVSSVRRDGAPESEPPADSDEPDPSTKPQE